MLIKRGRLRPFSGAITGVDPFAIIRNGALVVDDGEVLDYGTASEMIAEYPDAPIVDSPGLLTPGHYDAHVHYSQTRIMGTFGGGLLEWLESVTFPEEARFDDPAYARSVAREFCDALEAVGTTSATVFCASSPVSVDALFEEARHRSLRICAGLVMMDRNAPSALLTPAMEAYDQSRALIERWHGAENGRLTYAITPRFAPTSTPALLEAAATLWEEFPTCTLQTHLAESTDEVEWVRRLFPDAPDYLGVYESFGLVGPGAIFAHAIHLSDREVGLLAESGAVVAHCPTANRFLGSGRCNVTRLLKAGVTVQLGSDVGAGTTFDMLEVAAEAEGVPQRRRPVDES
ncbi:guanine deaminase [Acuticoccus sediminis]|uniref:Guanine deaminase n=1 Tax=Acuticoccus sediminis TaxID=2184697 RepID=A0A8B2NX85_9HYPH|nr:guanine deaminase [Acuticoccus sediminis]RAI03280.1 guanine deaminase [Acuticoccus sediminis]